MSALYPDEALDRATLYLAEGARRDIERALQSNEALVNGAGETHAVFALALALAWRLQTYPMWVRRILYDGAAELIRVNALEPEAESEGGPD